MSDEPEMNVMSLTYVDIFNEEAWSSLYDLLEEAIVRSCERHGLDPSGVETWAIGYTHRDVGITKVRSI